MDYTLISINPQKAVNEMPASDFFSDIDYIPLESNDDHLIGQITQMLIYQDKIYILDLQQHTVFCFQKDGKFLFEINKKGTGPGEYVELDNISIDHDKNHLLLCNNSINKILVFDLNGNYIQTYKIDCNANVFTYIADGYSAFFGDFTANPKYEKEQNTPNLLITRLDEDVQKVQYTDLFFPSNINFGATVSPATCFSSYQSGTVTLLEAYNDTIYHLLSNKVERAYYIDFGDMKKGDGFYSLLYNPVTDSKKIFEYETNHNVCNIIGLSETSKNIFFVYYHNKTKFHFVFYDKSNKKIIDIVKVYSPETGFAFPVNNDINGGPFAMPYWTDENSFYGFVEPYELLTYKNAILQSNAKNKDELLKKLNNIVEDDNPVIVKMVPKIK
jgi:hypothetical protein